MTHYTYEDKQCVIGASKMTHYTYEDKQCVIGASK